MLFLTEDATLVCAHETGHVSIAFSQEWVTVTQRKVLVETDPEGRTINGCVLAPPLKRCLKTLAVKEGYSELIRIDGHRICLDTVTGLTTGDPQGIVHYKVRHAGQDFISEVP